MQLLLFLNERYMLIKKLCVLSKHKHRRYINVKIQRSYLVIWLLFLKY